MTTLSPMALMAGRRVPLRLVIFDCDGVLIDSEGLTNRVVAEELTKLGWPLTAAEAETAFLGMSFSDMVPVIERHIGRAIPAGWQAILTARLTGMLAHDVATIDGAEAVLHATTALGLAWRVASNSSHEEMAAKFGANGMTSLVAGRLHSYRDVPRGKPAPDLFLAAAAAGGVAPADCVVIEDSVTGATGARAAGMDVLGLVRHGDGAALQSLGAAIIRSLHELPALFELGMRNVT